MRRYERERNDTSGGGRGFRILEAGGRYLEPLTPPPPPRAPEPYKVVPPSSSLGRAHRRSSFVIIAETRPATPCSRSPSPTFLAAGRVSPFRGRGFKGPLPHAQSRPQSPEIREENGRRGHGRYERRASVSQQNSPKRSLIPQPTRRRSVSLPKNEERKTSPKFGRRALPLTRKNSSAKLANGGANVSRRPSLKRPELSPIQGTPTRPSEGANRFRGGNSFVSGVSPVKSRNSLTVPKNNVNSRRAFAQNKSPSKVAPRSKRFIEEKTSNGEDESPTKIPVRRGSLVNKNGSTQSSSTTRFVNKSVKPGARTVKVKPDKPETNSKVNGKGENSKRSEVDETSEELPASRFIDMSVSPSETKKKHQGDLGLIDLLKQSSGATGTSSVVNTTTTTAVQPLQIEAAGILLEKNRAKSTEGMNGKSVTTTPSSTSLEVSPSSVLTTAPTADNSSSSSTTKIPKSTNPNHGTGMNEKKSENGGQKDVGAVNAGSTSMTIANNSNQKNFNKGNIDESSKKEQSNSTNNSQGTKEGKNLVGTNAGSRKNLLTKNGIQEGSRGEMRIPSGKPGSRSNNANNNINNNNNPSRSNEQTGSGKPASNATKDSVVVASVKPTTDNGSEIVPSLVSGHRKTGSRGSAKSTNGAGNNEGVDVPRTLSRNVGAVINNTETTTNNSRIAANGDNNGKIRTNHGSENSLKSSNGVSNVSIESVRSTDTGVSVNTVRGVSSAREKKGVHVMKRSEEIETLSGNVMQLERNGEPAVLDIVEGAEDQQELTRLGRFKKSLARLNDRLPSMRCLGCRRNQKAHAWTGEQRSQALGARSNERTNVTDDNDNTGNTRRNRMWTSFKTACRCTRLRECKCCRRAARVAPEETTPCCPPERRCGAICGKLFSRCKCNRSEAQATRSIRAKHSLTSVAPPPLSEEQRAKIPEVLVEHNSVMRGAIPCLPVPIAWFCLVWNVILPGSGTIWSGLFNLCVGQPRFAVSAGPRARIGALVVNLLVGVGQLFTVLFCLVGWGWSIWWGVIMIRLARKYKRFRASEAANSDLEARAGEQAAGLPPGVPSQALRGMERAR